MSLILDALNRSRQDEKQVPERAPGLESPHFRAPPPAAGIRWLVLLAVALCIALGVIAWLLLAQPPAGSLPENPRPGAPVPNAGRLDARGGNAATAPHPESGRPAQGRPAEGRPAEGIAVERKPAPEIAQAIPVPPPAGAPTAATAPAPSAGRQEATNEPAGEAPVPVAAEDEEVAALYRQPPTPAPAATPEPARERTASPAPRREERPIDIEAMVAQAQEEMVNRGLQDNPVPLLASLSQQFKDRVPSIMYLRHDYSGTPGKSTVVLNGRTVAAGGSLPGGIKVEEILPDSVILSYQGTRFRLRALNSWVNL